MARILIFALLTLFAVTACASEDEMKILYDFEEGRAGEPVEPLQSLGDKISLVYDGRHGAPEGGLSARLTAAQGIHQGSLWLEPRSLTGWRDYDYVAVDVFVEDKEVPLTFDLELFDAASDDDVYPSRYTVGRSLATGRQTILYPIAYPARNNFKNMSWDVVPDDQRLDIDNLVKVRLYVEPRPDRDAVLWIDRIRLLKEASLWRTIYVSPDGDDSWSGGLAEPDASGSDGPLATIDAARRAVRAALAEDSVLKEIRVVLRAGTYFLDETLAFAPEDCGRPVTYGGWNTELLPAVPVVYSAYEGEKVVLSGGRAITGWQPTTVNGVDAWVAELPEVRNGSWRFAQLWVNGRRRYRPRLPREGEYRVEALPGRSADSPWPAGMQEGSTAFVAREGDISRDWRNLQDVEITFYTLWVAPKANLSAYDPATRVASLDRDSFYSLKGDFQDQGAPYIVENVFEALVDPGQWYLDRAEGRLYYIPMPGEDMASAEVIAPLLSEVVRVEGGAATPAQQIVFEDLVISHNEWPVPADYACSEQSSRHVTGGVVVRHARHVALRRCALTHMGTYALVLEEDVEDCIVEGNRMSDLGAGGVRIWHGCRQNTLADNDIGDGGILYPSGVGVFIGNSTGNKILHNNIHDFYYSGMSIGWTWGYRESNTYGNIVEWNHIHDIGKALLSDMGGIYTLGRQQGTRLRYNRIHDIKARTYGGWAVYHDEGSTDILVENNVCYRTSHTPYNQHYGRNNVARNNVFAFGGEAQISRGRTESHTSFIFQCNIVLGDNGRMFAPNSRFAPDNVALDGNLYWDLSGSQDVFNGMTLSHWRKSGLDTSSIFADPLFVDPQNGDFRLREGSPAAQIGFVPFDLGGVGPRPGRLRPE